MNISEELYFWVTLLIHVTFVGVALITDNIEWLIEVSGAFGFGSFAFLFPSLAYILTVSKFGNSKDHHSKKWMIKFFSIIAWPYIAIYAILIAGFIFKIVMKMQGKIPDTE